MADFSRVASENVNQSRKEGLAGSEKTRNSDMTENDEDETIRIADASYHDQLIPSSMQDPHYAAVLERIQYMDNDEEILECLASYEQQKDLKQREEKYQLALLQLKHEQALQLIKEKTELEKAQQHLEQEKENRRKQVQPLLMWIARNMIQMKSPDEKMLFSAKAELEQFIEKKRFLSYEVYGHVQQVTNEKFSSIIEDITNFPIDVDDDYVYDG